MREEYVYRERQLVWGLLLVLAATVCIGLPIHAMVDPATAWRAYAAVVAIMVPIVLVLGSLTVEVGGGELRWHFGWLGRPAWRLPLAEIARLEPCRTHWIEGWGIRSTREGWLYNAAGRDALRIVRRDGRCLRLGSADVAALHRVLQARLGG